MSTASPSSDPSANDVAGLASAVARLTSLVTGLSGQLDQLSDLASLSERVDDLGAKLDNLNNLTGALVRALDTPQFRGMVESHLSVLASLQKAVQNTGKRIERLSEIYTHEATPEPSLMEMVAPFMMGGNGPGKSGL